MWKKSGLEFMEGGCGMSAFKYGSRPNGETIHVITNGENAHPNRIFKNITL
jgi:hypothetical protein